MQKSILPWVLGAIILAGSIFFLVRAIQNGVGAYPDPPSVPGPPAPASDLAKLRREREERVAGELANRIPDRGTWNLLWISLDSLRPDRMSVYGAKRRTTPQLEAFAKDAIVFERVWAPSSATVPSVLAMFRRRSYLASGILNASEARIEPADIDREGFPGELRRAGLRTCAVVRRPGDSCELAVLHATAIAGFESVKSCATLADQVAAVRECFSEGEGRRFVWVHLTDPRSPYEARPDFDFGASIRDRYDSEVAAGDEAIGRVLRALSAAGAAARTLVVVHGTHGEAFGEQGATLFHGTTLFEDQLRVPLIMRLPGLEPRRLARQASMLHAAPAVASILGIHPTDHWSEETVADLVAGEWPYSGSPTDAEMSDVTVGARPWVGYLQAGPWNRGKALAGTMPGEAQPGRVTLESADELEKEAEWFDRAMQKRDKIRGSNAAAVTAMARSLVEQRGAERARAINAIRRTARGFEPGLPSGGSLARPEDLPVARAIWLREVPSSSGADLLPSIREALAGPRRSWSEAAAALDALAEIVVEGEDEALREGLAKLLAEGATVDPAAETGPESEAKRALAFKAALALALARRGDARGRALLASRFDDPDPGVAFDAACGLASLSTGGESAEPSESNSDCLTAGRESSGPCRRIVDELPGWAIASPPRALRGIALLAERRNGNLVEAAVRIAGTPDVPRPVLLALVRGLARLRGQDSHGAWFPLLVSEDALVAREAAAALKGLVGEQRFSELLTAAFEFRNGLELAQQGRNREAWQALLVASDATRGGPAAALVNVYAARLAHAADMVTDRDRYVAAVVRELTAPGWRQAARMLAGLAREPEPLSWSAAVLAELPGPWTDEVVVRARVWNTGKTPVAGGAWNGAPRFVVEACDAEGRIVARGPAAFLPESGLAHLDGAAVFARIWLPRGLAWDHLEFSAQRPGGEPWPGRDQGAEDAARLAPRPHVHISGACLVVHAESAGAMTDPASFVSDPAWAAPSGAPEGPLEIRLTAAALGSAAKEARLDVSVERDPRAAKESEPLSLDLPADGAWHRLSITVPRVEGSRISRVVVAPAAGCDLLAVRAVEGGSPPRGR